MGQVVATCDGCGVRFRTARPEAASAACCPKCHAPLAPAIARALASMTTSPNGSTTPSPDDSGDQLAVSAASGPQATAVAAGPRVVSKPPSAASVKPLPVAKPATLPGAAVEVVAGTSVVVDHEPLAQPAVAAPKRVRVRAGLIAGAAGLVLALGLGLMWTGFKPAHEKVTPRKVSRAAVVETPRPVTEPADEDPQPPGKPAPSPQPEDLPAPKLLALAEAPGEETARNALDSILPPPPPSPAASVLVVPKPPRPEGLPRALSLPPPPPSPGPEKSQAGPPPPPSASSRDLEGQQGAGRPAGSEAGSKQADRGSGHTGQKGQTSHREGSAKQAAQTGKGDVPKAEAPEPRRLLVVDNGQPMVVRELGKADDKLIVLLPNGEVGWVSGRAFTDKPFKPNTMDEMRESLKEGRYRNFRVRQTAHYLIFYRCNEQFADSSAKLLETLYQGLSKKLAENGFEVHEAEFPMVAVIYDTERAFRDDNHVAPDVQAYYHLLSNRIYFYETSSREESSPEVSAIRKPQTIAHEGTHQILQNIGVQPRMAKWPLWLVEGLAEYWAPTTTGKGAKWLGGGHVNALHMATIRDLEDQELYRRSRGFGNPRPRDVHSPIVSYIVPRTELSPTDYAIAWALTHYLATRRTNDFIDFLKTMSRLQPGSEPTPKEHLKMFREAFGDDLAKIDKSIYQHVGKLKYDPIPYYAVMLERVERPGIVFHEALVSQSPTTIRQWIDAKQADGRPVQWQALEFPNKTPAMQAADVWVNR